MKLRRMRSQRLIHAASSSVAMNTTTVESINSRYLFRPAFPRIPWPRGAAQLVEDLANELGDFGHEGRIRKGKLARQEGLEPPTNGFGDHYSTN